MSEAPFQLGPHPYSFLCPQSLPLSSKVEIHVCRHSRSPVWARVTPRHEAGLRLLALPWCPKLLFSLGHIHTASSAPRLCLLVADLKKSTSEQFDLWINYSGRERPLHSKHHTVFSGSDTCFSVCWFKLSSFVYQLSVLFSATSRSRSNF